MSYEMRAGKRTSSLVDFWRCVTSVTLPSNDSNLNLAGTIIAVGVVPELGVVSMLVLIRREPAMSRTPR